MHTDTGWIIIENEVAIILSYTKLCILSFLLVICRSQIIIFRREWITGVYDWIHSTQNIKVHLDFFCSPLSVISENIYLDEIDRIDKVHKHLIAKETFRAKCCNG